VVFCADAIGFRADAIAAAVAAHVVRRKLRREKCESFMWAPLSCVLAWIVQRVERGHSGETSEAVGDGRMFAE
jgi:hypothetical protein